MKLEKALHARDTLSDGRVIDYRIEPDLGAKEFVDLLERSTLAERRPVDEPETISGMLAHADVLVTARHDTLLIGVSRAISDFHYCTYLSDLAVAENYQRMGIGRRMIELTHRAAGQSTTLILLSAPKAVTYYPHIGMTNHPSCWTIARR